jgi:hypothetical protein
MSSRRIECVAMSYSFSVILFLCVVRCHGNLLTEPLLSNGPFRLVTQTCVNEQLASNGLFRLSGVMSQYVSIYDSEASFFPEVDVMYIINNGAL